MVKQKGKIFKSAVLERWVFLILIFSAIIGMLWLTIPALGFDIFGLGEEEITPETPTDFEFLVLYFHNGEEIDDSDHEIYIYRVDVSELTDDEIDDLEWEDYTFDEGKDSGESYDPDSDFMYWAIANGSDLIEYQFVPILGVNTIYLMNATEDVSMVAYSKDELSTTINQTTYDKWVIVTQTLNGSEGEGNVTTSTEGYLPYYDFRTDSNQRVVLNITLNTTASLSDVDFDSPYDHSIDVSGNSIYIEINATLLGQDEFEIDFDSDIGTDYVPVSIGIGYGNSASYTEWDSQT